MLKLQSYGTVRKINVGLKNLVLTTIDLTDELPADPIQCENKNSPCPTS